MYYTVSLEAEDPLLSGYGMSSGAPETYMYTYYSLLPSGHEHSY